MWFDMSLAIDDAYTFNTLRYTTTNFKTNNKEEIKMMSDEYMIFNKEMIRTLDEEWVDIPEVLTPVLCNLLFAHLNMHHWVLREIVSTQKTEDDYEELRSTFKSFISKTEGVLGDIYRAISNEKSQFFERFDKAVDDCGYRETMHKLYSSISSEDMMIVKIGAVFKSLIAEQKGVLTEKNCVDFAKYVYPVYARTLHLATHEMYCIDSVEDDMALPYAHDAEVRSVILDEHDECQYDDTRMKIVDLIYDEDYDCFMKELDADPSTLLAFKFNVVSFIVNPSKIQDDGETALLDNILVNKYDGIKTEVVKEGIKIYCRHGDDISVGNPHRVYHFARSMNAADNKENV